MQVVSFSGNLGDYSKELFSRWTFQAIVQTSVSVDSFFMLSGLLCVYLFLKDFEKRNVGLCCFLKEVPMQYLHRYLR